jgi:hypothetical protein
MEVSGMTEEEGSGGLVHDLKRVIKGTANKSGARSHDSGGKVRRNVNLAARANVVAATNLGRDGASHGASAKQRVRIQQDGDATYEEVDTAKTSY